MAFEKWITRTIGVLAVVALAGVGARLWIDVYQSVQLAGVVQGMQQTQREMLAGMEAFAKAINQQAANIQTNKAEIERNAAKPE